MGRSEPAQTPSVPKEQRQLKAMLGYKEPPCPALYAGVSSIVLLQAFKLSSSGPRPPPFEPKFDMEVIYRQGSSFGLGVEELDSSKAKGTTTVEPRRSILSGFAPADLCACFPSLKAFFHH